MILKARPCGVEYFENLIRLASYSSKTVSSLAKKFYTQLIKKGMEFKYTEHIMEPYVSVKTKSGYRCYLTKEDMEHVYEVKNV